eukprot:s4018_g2.t1
MEILKELATLSSKTHNWFAGLSGIGRSAQSAAQDAKEAAERGLEIGEKTLAAVRVGGPSPSETELLEAVADIQRTLTEVRDKLGEVAQNAEAAKAGGAPTSSPPPTAAPTQMGTPTELDEWRQREDEEEEDEAQTQAPTAQRQSVEEEARSRSRSRSRSPSLSDLEAALETGAAARESPAACLQGAATGGSNVDGVLPNVLPPPPLPGWPAHFVKLLMLLCLQAFAPFASRLAIMSLEAGLTKDDSTEESGDEILSDSPDDEPVRSSSTSLLQRSAFAIAGVCVMGLVVLVVPGSREASGYRLRAAPQFTGLQETLFGTVDAGIYTYGAPGTAESALPDLSHKDCFEALRLGSMLTW